MKLALVTWRDAVTEHADMAGPAHAQTATLTDVGFLLDENTEAVLIGMESHQEGSEIVPGRFRLHIPRRNIISLHIVEVGKAFPKKTLVWQA